MQTWSSLESRPSGHNFDDQFHPFIFLDGIEATVAASFQIFLQDLYSQTGECWIPTFCRAIRDSLPVARKILVRHSSLASEYQVTALGFQNVHFWLGLLDIHDQHVLVIDPSGVPKNPREYSVRDPIIPHFGLIDSAHVYAQTVYTQSVALKS